MNKENAKSNVATGVSSTIGAAVGVVGGTFAAGELHAAEANEATVTGANPAQPQGTEPEEDIDVPIVDTDPAHTTANAPTHGTAAPAGQPAAQAEPVAQPASQTTGEVQVLDYQTVTTPDGQTADVAVLSDGTNQAVVIDADQDGIADVIAADLNHDGLISDNEIVDIQDQNIAMQPMQEAAGSMPGSGDMMAQNASYEPDYVNDANVDGFAEA